MWWCRSSWSRESSPEQYCRSRRIYRAQNLDTKEICLNHNSLKTLDHLPIRKVLIANIDQNTTHKKLKLYFSRYGKVVDCILKKKSGKKKSYAFITYREDHEAQRAIDAGYNKDININGQYLRVLPAASWHQPDSTEKQICKNISDKVDDEQIPVYNNYVIDDDKATIHMLNNDCLMHIFMNLSIIDRVKIERVCKRWQVVSKESWHMHKKFDFTPSKWGFKSLARYEISLRNMVNAPAVYKVLWRCGSYLTHIDLSEYTENLGNATLIAIAQLCPNIQSINIKGFKFSSSGIKALAEKCNNIEKFTIGFGRMSHNVTYTFDNELSLLFSKNRKLQYLEIDCRKITGKCLLHLPVKSVQELMLNDTDTKVDSDIVSNVIQKLHLRTLRITGLNRTLFKNPAIIKAVTLSAKFLEVLDISSYSIVPYLSNSRPELNPIAELTNLKVLNLSKIQEVNDDFLITLAVKCKDLLNIDISFCSYVTNRGLTCITSLPKLEHLFINGLKNISDEVLTDMPNLKTLDCSSCKNVHYVGLITLIITAENIEQLVVSNCHLITNELIDAAIEATRHRKKTVLKIYVNGTSIKIDKINGSSPFLQVLTK